MLSVLSKKPPLALNEVNYDHHRLIALPLSTLYMQYKYPFLCCCLFCSPLLCLYHDFHLLLSVDSCILDSNVLRGL